MTVKAVLQFRIELLHIKPLIWRRIQVPDTYSFWDLHVAIQSAFDWNDSHLHEFEVPAGRNAAASRFGVPLEEEWDDEGDSRPPLLPGWKHQVTDYLSLAQPKADYVYDFGDHWQHVLTLEEVVAPGPGRKYPRCTAGERSAPPDDCGGSGGYEELLEALADPMHEEHARFHRWAASIKGVRKFDPEAFDEQQVKFENPAPRLKRMLAEIGDR